MLRACCSYNYVFRLLAKGAYVLAKICARCLHPCLLHCSAMMGVPGDWSRVRVSCRPHMHALSSTH
jgi:hypothetical protein